MAQPLPSSREELVSCLLSVSILTLSTYTSDLPAYHRQKLPFSFPDSDEASYWTPYSPFADEGLFLKNSVRISSEIDKQVGQFECPISVKRITRRFPTSFLLELAPSPCKSTRGRATEGCNRYLCLGLILCNDLGYRVISSTFAKIATAPPLPPPVIFAPYRPL